MRTVRFEVRGLVQGVGFRWFTVSAARALGLRGWARNEPDGRVAVLAAGDDQALAELEAALGRGPAGARVDAVSREPAQVDVPLPDPFTILR